MADEPSTTTTTTGENPGGAWPGTKDQPWLAGFWSGEGGGGGEKKGWRVTQGKRGKGEEGLEGFKHVSQLALF